MIDDLPLATVLRELDDNSLLLTDEESSYVKAMIFSMTNGMVATEDNVRSFQQIYFSMQTRQLMG